MVITEQKQPVNYTLKDAYTAVKGPAVSLAKGAATVTAGAALGVATLVGYGAIFGTLCERGVDVSRGNDGCGWIVMAVILEGSIPMMLIGATTAVAYAALNAYAKPQQQIAPNAVKA